MFVAFHHREKFKKEEDLGCDACQLFRDTRVTHASKEMLSEIHHVGRCHFI